MHKTITPKEAAALNKKGAVFLDIRTKRERDSFKIEDSLWIDFYSDFMKNAIKLDKNKEYIIYCNSANRSKLASKMLSDLGYLVNELEGGIQLWRQQGFLVV